MRTAALNALHGLDHLRLDAALAAAALDADLERNPLLGRVEVLLEERKIRLADY